MEVVFKTGGEGWLRPHLTELRAIDRLIDEINRALAGIAVSDPGKGRVELLVGFTDIDYYNTPHINYEIGYIRRFSNPRKLMSRVDKPCALV